MIFAAAAVEDNFADWPCGCYTNRNTGASSYNNLWVNNHADCDNECDRGCDCGCVCDCDGVCDGPGENLDYWFDADGDGLGAGESSEFCSSIVEDGWVLNGDDEDDNCASNYHDCWGDCDGSAFIDDCGTCAEGNSGHVANTNQDCEGICFGEAVLDDCGVCSEGTSNQE